MGARQDDSENIMPIAVFDRLKAAGDFRFDTDLAADMGVERTAIGKWRQRGTLPVDTLIAYARRKGYSLDWLFLGMEPMYSSDKQHMVQEEPASYTDFDLILFRNIASHVRDVLAKEKYAFSDEKIDSLIGYIYHDTIRSGGQLDIDKVKELLRIMA